MKDSVDFIFNKFDDFECDRLEKEKIIKDLKEEVTYLREKVDDIAAETDKQEQYSRRKCLLIHGLSKNENTDLLVMEVIETKIQRYAEPSNYQISSI